MDKRQHKPFFHSQVVKVKEGERLYDLQWYDVAHLPEALVPPD